ncbi:MAG: TolB family protein, partial [Bacteroidota bacterium]
YQHADELAVDLKAIRAATPSTSKVLNSVSMPVASGLHVKRATLPLWLSGGMFGAALLVGAGIMWVLKPDPIIEPQPVARFVIPFETDSPADGMTSCALSPDGTKLAYKLRRRSNDFLYVRDMDKLDARLVLSAQGIDQSMVFFSPDGRWLAFFSQGKLSKLSLAGGPPIAICDAPNTGSGS